MIRSLRARLYVGLTAVITLTGVIGAVFAYHWAFDEAIEIQDSLLIQIASLAQNGPFGGIQPSHGIEEDAEVQLIELGTTPRGPADDRQLFTLKDGLQTATRGGQLIRLLLRTRPDGSRYAAVQPTAIRDQTAREMAFRTLFPFVALLPCLILVTALVIATSLRPLIRQAGELDARRADDPEPLPISGMPSELHPFIAAINGLLARTQLLMDQQKRFIADAAHELRSPVAALSLQTENLDSIDFDGQARERVTALKQGMRRARHLLDQLLALARQEAINSSTEMPLVTLEGAAKEVVAGLMQRAGERGIDLGFALVEPLMVRSEPVMLTTMIRNLLDNALRFTPHNGRIDVGVYRQDGAAVLQVEDSGPGIAPGDMDRIFEPFFRGQLGEGEGSGLGLSIVKRIVERLGGAIALENVAGAECAGLRVIIRLPLAGAAPERSSHPAG